MKGHRWRHLRGAVHSGKALLTGRPAPADQPPSSRDEAAQFRLLLQERGPVYSCFGLYLASRIDLMPAEYCRELALIPDAAPELSSIQVREIMISQTGPGFERGLASFDALPHKSTLLAQYHQATLSTGGAVMTAILRPEYYSLRDESLPELTEPGPLNPHCSGFAIAEAIADFRDAMLRKADFRAAAEAMGGFGTDEPAAELLLPCRVYQELSTERILTFDPPNGRELDRIEQPGAVPNFLPRLLCHAWLAQALLGRFFPVDPRPHQITVSPENRVAFCGCEFDRIPGAAQDDLWNYLISTLTDDPDRAVTYLLKNMYPPSAGGVEAGQLRSSFRQSAYFGELEPILGNKSSALAQLIYQHWKTARAFGYRPKPHLLNFYRGIFSMARIGYRLSPECDHLREAMEELRGRKIASQLGEIADWDHTSQNLERFAVACAQFPKILDDALTRLSKPEPPDSSGAREGRRNGSLPSFIAIAVIALTLVLRPSGLSRFTENVVLAVLMIAGLMALRGDS